MRVIDLTMPLRPHWRWEVSVETVRDFGPGQPFRVSELRSNVHALTHVDAQLHVLPDAPSIDQVPLSHLAGPASLIDLSSKGPCEAITAEDLERNGPHVQNGDIVLLRTCWDQKYSFESHEYWTQACYVSESACEWLFDCSPSAVGYDFPQDPALRGLGSHTGESSTRGLQIEGFTTHRLLLARGIYSIEYLANLHEISSPRFYVFALPLRLEGAEAAPARVVAVEF